MPNLLENHPGVVRDTVTRLAVVNNCKIKRAIDEGIGVKKANPFSKGAEVLRSCMIR